MSSRAKRGDLFFAIVQFVGIVLEAVRVKNRKYFLINFDISDNIIQAVFCVRGVK